MKKYSLLILSLLLSLSVAAQRGRQLPLPDYSYCGYQASEAAIPMVPIKAVVPATDQDATASIQAALDYVASLPLDEQGFRGAVLLEKGTYRISQTLWIKASGVVLRGSGISSEGTELLSTSRDRLTMIRVKGQDDRTFDKDKSAQVVATAPVGAMSLSLSEQVFRQGDRVIIQQFPNVSWERTVTDVKGKTIHLDAPITYELTSDKPAMVSLLSWPGRIEGVGIENLRINSVYDETNLMDENHAWIGIALENVRDAWVRAVEFRHLAGSAVFVAETASRVTVQDCKSLEPISEIGAQRRYSFYVKGSQVLCQRIQAEEGYHDFAVAASHGPNAFVQCWSLMPYSYSGCIESWSSGVLFDICSVSGNALRTNIPNYADAFAGWTTTNTTFWNSTASMVSCVKPQVAGNNYAYGAWGQFNGRGHWESPNSHVNPWSLYYTQLERRLGKASPEADKLIGLGRGGTSSIQDAAYQTAKARRPLTMLSTWIDSLLMADPFVVSYDDKALTQVWQSFVKAPKEAKDYPSIELKDGILQRDGKILTGGRRGCTWWRGNPRQTAQSDPHLVRYALGPEGYGLVDDLKDVTDFMKEKNILVTDFHYALWLDRRRDDHQRTARIDGEQRAPFYELPFARSGQGRAWDGLSLYDLTKWNNWYWNRLATYADLADEKGLMLFYQHYFQHNILEAGGHWADFPWRSANNVNETGFPEPTPYAGNKRVFMAEHFYDVDHPQRRELHRNYIRKCLDNFADKGSVMHFISEEFTGPYHFVAFWLDEIIAWEKENNKQVLVALSCTKDVQDSILDNPRYAEVIDAIDIKYWYVDGNGKPFAPDGGLNLSPRQFERIMKPAPASWESVYDMVSEYRSAYPDKAVVYSASRYPELAWGAFMAGASICNLPAGLPEKFLQDATKMSPIGQNGIYMMSNPDLGYILYPSEKAEIDLRSLKSGEYKAQYLDVKTGEPVGKVFRIKAGEVFRHTKEYVLWLYR